jgi:hypothetical protein
MSTGFPILVFISFFSISQIASAEGFWSKFSRSTGLLDELLTIFGVRKDIAPIKICPGLGGGAGYIAAARAIAASRGVEIYGNVQTTWGYEAPLRAHVDIFFRLRNGKIIPGRAVDYFPRTIPPSTRGSIPLSHFFAQFNALPEQTDAVLMRFHQVERSQCDLAIPKDCENEHGVDGDAFRKIDGN